MQISTSIVGWMKTKLAPHLHVTDERTEILIRVSVCIIIILCGSDATMAGVGDDEMLEVLRDMIPSLSEMNSSYASHIVTSGMMSNTTTTTTPASNATVASFPFNLNLSEIFGICDGQWMAANHILFQLANSFLFLAYLAPPGLHGLLYLRACLMIGSLFFTLWGWIVLCALDTLVWNAMFTVINIVHIAVLLYTLRPVTFSHEIEMVYRNLFKPLRVSRHHFKKALDCMREIQTLKPRDPYCIEKVTHVDRLALVLSGRLMVSQRGRTLHVVDSHQFLDSPEWFGVCSDEYYQVSVTALEECRLLVWHRDKLKLSIAEDSFLQAVFDNVLGKDVVKKLMLVSETCNGSMLLGDGDLQTTHETTKLLSVKPSGHEGGIRTGLDVLLTRQIDCRDCNVWNLGKIAEDPHDNETTV